MARRSLRKLLPGILDITAQVKRKDEKRGEPEIWTWNTNGIVWQWHKPTATDKMVACPNLGILDFDDGWEPFIYCCTVHEACYFSQAYIAGLIVKSRKNQCVGIN